MIAAKERMRDFWARQKAKGLKRIQLWARPEDVEALREASRQPDALARLRKEVRAEVTAEIAEETGRDMERVAAFCSAVERFLAARDGRDAQDSQGVERK